MSLPRGPCPHPHPATARSQGPPPEKLTVDLGACTQCKRDIPRSAARESRHALPCGHVFCAACTAKVAAERAGGSEVKCVVKCCDVVLCPTAEWVPAACTGRSHRLADSLARTLADQGNVGDAPPAPQDSVESKGSPAAAQASALGAMAKLASRIGVVKAALEEAKLDPVADHALITDWAARETAVIKAWEADAVAELHKAAENTCALVAEVLAVKLHATASALAQRRSLVASLEEIEAELADAESGRSVGVEARDAAAASGGAELLPSVLAEQAGLVRALEEGSLQVLRTDGIATLTSLPSLGKYFSGPQARPIGEVAAGASPSITWVRWDEGVRAAQGALNKCRDEERRSSPLFLMRALFPNGPPAFPEMPALVSTVLGARTSHQGV